MEGKETKNIMRLVKTFRDALMVLGYGHPFVKQYVLMELYRSNSEALRIEPLSKDLTAYIKLRIICAALNDGWEPTFDGSQYRYYPWFYIHTKKEYEELDGGKKKELRAITMSHGRVFVDTSVVCASATITTIESGTSRSSRIALKTRELAEYCGKQFIDIWADYLFG